MYEPRSLLYRLVVIATGVGWLGWTLLQPRDPIHWEVVGIFTLLSWTVKRAGFRFTDEMRHSLVNVVDVGALLVLGPLGGAIVGSVSSVLHIQFSLLRRHSRHWTEFFDLPLFDGALKVLLALAGGSYYLQMGGLLAPTTVPLSLFLPLAILYIFWFSLDHLAWVCLFLLTGGVARAREFLQRIARTSLVVELAPLPFSIALAVGWTIFDPVLRLLLLTATVLVALIARGFALALRRAEAQIETVSLLNKFGQALVLAQLDEDKLTRLLYDYAGRLFPRALFELVLVGADHQPRPVLVFPEQQSRLAPLMPLILPLLQERPRGRLLPALTPEALTDEAQRTAQDRPDFGGALLIPLMASDALLGVFLAEDDSRAGLTLDDGRTLSILATQAAVTLQNARHFRREQWRVRQLQAIAEVSRLVASVIRLEDFLWQVVELVRATFGYYHVQIYLVEPGRDEVVYRAGSGEAGRKLARLPMRLRIGQDGIVGWVAGQRQPLLVNDVAQDPRFLPDMFHLLPDSRAELALPLMAEDRILGVLDVQADTPNSLDEDDLFTLATLADQIAVAIQEARLAVAQREEAWVAAALLQVVEAVSPLFDLAAVLETIARMTPRLVGVEGAAIFLWRSEDRLFDGAAAHGLPHEIASLIVGQRIPPDDFALLDVVRDRAESVLIERADQTGGIPDDLAAALGERGLLALPLEAQGGFVGVLLLARQTLATLSARRRTLAAGIAQQTAVSIQAASLYAAQREEAAITTDLLQVAELVASRTDLRVVLEMVTRLVVQLSEAQTSAVFLWDEAQHALVPAEAHGFAPEVEAAWRETTLPARDFGALVVLWDAHEPVLLGTGGPHPLGCDPLQTLFNCETLVAMPLRSRDSFLGLVMVEVTRQPPRLTRRLRAVLTGIARQLSIALENGMLYEEALQNARRTQELVVARQIQTALLPDQAPQVPGYDIAGYWRPAREVAGDFYDFLQLSQGRLAFSIADVADKGIGAALFMVLARTALRESLWIEEDAGRALDRANALIAADVRNGMFLTVFQAILSPQSGHLQAANAGHLPPLVFHAASESLTSTVRRNLPLGILEDTRYSPVEMHLEVGDAMVLVTDGIMDTFNAAQEAYGLRRLSELVYKYRYHTAYEIVTAILDAATAHAAGEPFMDDLSLIVLRRVG